MPRTPSVKSLSGGGLSSPDLSSFGNYSHSHDHGNTTSTGAGTGTSGEHSDLPPAPTIVSAGVHHFTVGEVTNTLNIILLFINLSTLIYM